MWRAGEVLAWRVSPGRRWIVVPRAVKVRVSGRMVSNSRVRREKQLLPSRSPRALVGRSRYQRRSTRQPNKQKTSLRAWQGSDCPGLALRREILPFPSWFDSRVIPLARAPASLPALPSPSSTPPTARRTHRRNIRLAPASTMSTLSLPRPARIAPKLAG